MRIITPPEPIHRTEMSNGDLVITIPVKKRWFFILYFLMCLVIVTVLIIAFSSRIIMSETSAEIREPTSPVGIFVILFPIVIFTLTEALVIYVLLWQLAGKEIITLNKDTLVIIRQILGWKRRRAFIPLHISDIRVYQPNYFSISMFDGFLRVFGIVDSLAFDYGAKTYHFGNDLDEAEAKQIIKKLERYLAEHF